MSVIHNCDNTEFNVTADVNGSNCDIAFENNRSITFCVSTERSGNLKLVVKHKSQIINNGQLELPVLPANVSPSHSIVELNAENLKSNEPFVATVRLMDRFNNLITLKESSVTAHIIEPNGIVSCAVAHGEDGTYAITGCASAGEVKLEVMVGGRSIGKSPIPLTIRPRMKFT